MKTERADVLVGITTIGAIAIVAAVIVWLAGVRQQATYPVYTQFDEMTGITEQGGVFLRGYEIGRIREIQPVVSAGGTPVFRVRMDVRWSLAGGEPQALPVGTTAVLKPPPLIGAAYIELELPDVPGPDRLEPGAMIPGVTEPALAQQASRMSSGVVSDLGATMASARLMMDSLTQTTAAAHAFLAASTRSVPVLMAGIDAQLAAAGEVMEELRGTAAQLTPALLATVDSSAMLLSESRGMVRQLSATVEQTTPGIERILTNLENTTLVLDYFARQVAERPLRALGTMDVPSVEALRRASERRNAARADSVRSDGIRAIVRDTTG